MTTVKITGGLGNQMFQYATGLSVALQKSESLSLDLSDYQQQSPKDTPRAFELSDFNTTHTSQGTIHQSFISKLFLKIKNRLNLNNSYSFNPNIFNQKNLIGHFQNEKYFAQIRQNILSEFTLKNKSDSFKNIELDIQSTLSVALHVRRGDYVSNPHATKHHVVQSLEYYKKAYDVLVSKIGTDFTLYIFTDDISWTNENINFHPQTYTVSNRGCTSAEEIILMSKCQHNIIANSSFSWWGAWLNQNPDKIVIAPEQWTLKNSSHDIIPESWIKI